MWHVDYESTSNNFQRWAKMHTYQAMAGRNALYDIGVDIGGTFTDITVLRKGGGISIFKIPSTPGAPHKAVLDGIAEIIQRDHLVPANCTNLIISATVGLNSIVQRNGATVGLLVSQGFEDILELGRVKMRNVFSLDEVRALPLVRKEMVKGVAGRISPEGEEVQPLDKDQLVEKASGLIVSGAGSLAISFLHSYRNECHEREAQQILEAEFPNIPIARSSDIWPQMREFERTTALVMNSYVAPAVRSYISAISSGKAGLGLDCPLHISASNGGLVTEQEAIQKPISTLLSGPSAGVVAAVRLMQGAGLDQAITFDMGGTSADICVLEQDEIPYAWGQEIEGLPITVPYVDVSAIGSGGGSLAWIDNVGILKVGPMSAGSDPGPVAYGRGGTQPTLTDAYLCSGFINPDNFIGGKIKLDRQAAERAIADLAERLGLPLEEVVSGLIRIATSVQVAEFSRLAAQKGIDVRRFTLIAFGGAGPTHACLLADELRLQSVVIPATPGTFCAMGAVQADFRLDYIKSVSGPYKGFDFESAAHWFKNVETKARDALEPVAGQIVHQDLLKTADVRYLGQGHDVPVSFDRFDDIPQNFNFEYDRRYGGHREDLEIEITSLRATFVGKKGAATAQGEMSTDDPMPVAQRQVLLSGESTLVDVYLRQELSPGWSRRGPFLIDQPDTTCVVTAEWTARIDDLGNLHLRKDAK